eukprot:gb/GECH01002730.1/.p1 GENE.gb/GECH01002730.1/~~gb/GECH01002730.1/.p1  ORF type:complete len:1189 (+),score=277.17 gb/GECH01002730.1/:1-3567(+)
MDQKLEELVGAVNSLYSEQTSYEERQRALAMCNDFIDNNPQNAVTYSFYLLENPNNFAHHVLFFGLQALTRVIEQRWDSFNENDRSNFKSSVMSLFADSANSANLNTSEWPMYLKEKLAGVIVALAKREWPQLWPDLLPALQQATELTLSTLNNFVESRDASISLSNSHSAEIALLSLKILAQEVLASPEMFGDENIPEERRTDLIRSIVRFSNELLEWFSKILQVSYSTLQISVEMGGSPLQAPAAQITSIFLDTVNAFVPLVYPKKLFVHKLVEMVASLLGDSNYRDSAIYFLKQLVSSKWNKVNTDNIDDNITAEDAVTFVTELGQFCQNVLNNAKLDDPDEYEFHKEVCQCLVTFGKNNLHMLLDRNQNVIEDFLNLMIAFARHPSVYMYYITIEFWSEILTKENFIQAPFFEGYFGEIIDLVSSKIYRGLGDPDRPESNLNRNSLIFAQYDATNIDQRYLDLFGKLRGASRRIIGAIAEYQPQRSIEFAKAEVTQLLQQCPSAPFDDFVNSETGFSTVNSDTYAYWDGVAFVLKGIVDNMGEITHQSPVFVICNEIVDLLIEYSTNDPLLQSVYLSMLGAFTPFYEKNESVLLGVLNELFNHMQFNMNQPNASIDSLPEDCQAARRKAHTVFIKLAKKHGRALLPHINHLVERTHQILQAGKFREREAAFIYEAFTFISNEMRNFEQQSDFLHTLLNGFASELSSDQVMEVVSSPKSLLTCLGVLGGESIRASRLHFLLSVFWNTARSMPSKNPEQYGFQSTDGTIRYPIAPQLITVFPTVLSLIRTLHVLFSDEGYALVPPQMSGIFLLSSPERYGILGTKQGGPVAVKEPQVDAVCKYLTSFRETAYHLFAMTCKLCPQDIFYSGSLGNQLENYVFVNFEQLNLRHMKIFLANLIVPFCLYTPPDLFDSFIPETLGMVFNTVFPRILQRWDEMDQRNQGMMETNHGQTEEDEILEDKLLRDLTREIPGMMDRFTGSLSRPSEADERWQPEPSAFCLYLLDHETLFIPFFRMFCHLIGINDAQASRRAIYVSMRIVPYLGGYTKYHRLVGGELLYSALHTIMSTSDSQAQYLLVTLVRYIYMSIGKISSHPVEVVSQLPTVSQGKIERLHSYLSREISERQLNQVFRNFLKPIFGLNLNEGRTPPSTIVSIRDYGTQAPSATNKNDHWLTATNFELSNLFQS